MAKEYLVKILSARERSMFVFCKQTMSYLSSAASLGQMLQEINPNDIQAISIGNEELVHKLAPTTIPDFNHSTSAGKFGTAQFHVASTLLQMNIFRGIYYSHTDFVNILKAKKVLSVVEMYLEETKEPEERSITEFDVHESTLVEEMASSALLQLRGSYLERACKMMMLTARLSFLITQKEFDYSWLAFDSLVEGEPRNEEIIRQPSPEACTIRDALCQVVKECLDSDISEERDLCFYSLLCIMESFGCNSPHQAALWLFRLQSLQAKQWLSNVWSKSLSKTSELYTVWQRMKSYTKLAFPSKDEFKQNVSDKTFLSTTSLAYRR